MQKRIRDFNITIGSLPAGPLNKITDVPGVTVGHATIDTDTHKTGVTVILPTEGNIFRDKLVAASCVINGFGKTLGLVQVDELGTLETPIAITNTLNVGLVHDAIVDYMIQRCREDNISVRSINPVVCECNDGGLNHITERAVQKEHVYQAIAAASKDFEEGDTGAGKGTVCYGLKGGIGSASRTLTLQGKTFTLGVLVQSNHGRTDDLLIQGGAAGSFIRTQEPPVQPAMLDKGSIIMIVATDLPVSDRQLKRIIKRCSVGLIRTGSHLGHGSGDIVVGFSTANTICTDSTEAFVPMTILNEAIIERAFRAAAEACEEAILNSMVTAHTLSGYDGKTRYSLSEYLDHYLKQS